MVVPLPLLLFAHRHWSADWHFIFLLVLPRSCRHSPVAIHIKFYDAAAGEYAVSCSWKIRNVFHQTCSVKQKLFPIPGTKENIDNFVTLTFGVIFETLNNIEIEGYFTTKNIP